MTDEIEDALRAFRDSAADFLGGAQGRQRIRAQAGYDPGVWTRIAEQGWLSILVSEQEGGLGLGLRELCAIAVEVGRGLLPEPFLDAGVQPQALLACLPASPLRDRLLRELQSGACVIAVAWQESAGQLEPAARDFDVARRFVQPFPQADGCIVLARVEGEAALAWVPGTDIPPAVATRQGVDGSVQADLRFDDVHAGADAILARGPAAIRALSIANEITRLAQAAEAAGIARRALEITRDYLVTRVQFGKPIGSFQALQHRMVDALMHVELAEACLRDCIGQCDGWSQPAAQLDVLARAASRAKARCAHAATEVTRFAIQMHGAIGTTEEHDIGLYFRRALALSARHGNPTAHRRRYAALAAPAPDTAGNEAAAGSPPQDFSPHADWEAMDEATFRNLVRAFFRAHYPEHRRYMPYRQTWAESKDWYMTLSRLGWLAPAWPKEHGGMGLPPDKLIAYIEESEAYGVARAPDQGLVMVGPILMRFGTDEQRRRFLPPILAGEHVWTQGYSEPNAGSDLASVRTEAVLDGDEFVVNGQKTWTTWGADGTHMFMLVRTDKTVRKQAGISFLLVNLKTPGIDIRPIRNIAGEQDFCEVFFDNVRVPAANLVGALNGGWTIAKALLGFERLFTGSPKHSQHTLNQVRKLALQRGLFEDPAFASRFVELQLDTLDLVAAYTRFAEIAKRGETIPPTISILKIWSTETYERLALLLIDAAADYGAARDAVQSEGIDMHVVAPLFNALGAKIFAGSNEIQRNILAKAVLDLPS
jgi:alkylation response protein AidB-like acyl-CoA dehydrogenase